MTLVTPRAAHSASYKCVNALASLKMYMKGKLGSLSLLASMHPNHTATNKGNPAKALLTCAMRSSFGTTTLSNFCLES